MDMYICKCLLICVLKVSVLYALNMVYSKTLKKTHCFGEWIERSKDSSRGLSQEVIVTSREEMMVIIVNSGYIEDGGKLKF